MSHFLQFLIVLAVILTVAKLGGYLSLRIGQPAVAGEVLAGLILGPSLIDFLHWPVFTDSHLGETFTLLAEFGVLLMMFIAGLEVHMSDLRLSGRVAFNAGVLGFLAPLGLGYLAAVWMDFPPDLALFIGLLLAPTSVSISAQTLMELKVLRTRVGTSLLGAAVIDDILVVMGLSIFLALSGSGQTGGGADLIWLFVRMLAYLAISVMAGPWLLTRFHRWVERLPVSQAVVASALIMMMLFAWAAEFLGGVAAIIGAFIAGLSYARTAAKPQILTGFSSLAYSLFVPIFFINVGLNANLRDVQSDSLLLLAVLTVTAIFSKIIGTGIGGLLGKLSRKESFQLGVGMVPRGEVGLIVVSIGITEGLIDETLLSVAVAMVILTTLLAPPVLRALFRPQPAPPEPRPAKIEETSEETTHVSDHPGD